MIPCVFAFLDTTEMVVVFLPRGISWPFCFPRSGTSGWPGRLRPGPPSAFGPTGPHNHPKLVEMDLLSLHHSQ